MQVCFAVYAEHSTKGRVELVYDTLLFTPTQMDRAWGYDDVFDAWEMADGSPITGANVFSEGSPFAQGGKVQLTLELELQPQ